MNSFYKILLIIIAIAYLISPVDLIPDFMVPYVGWLDDAVVLWLIFYFLKFNRLPSFFYRQKKTGRHKYKDTKNYKNNSFSKDYGKRGQYENHRYGNTGNSDNNKSDNGNYNNTDGEKNTVFQNKKSKKNPYEVLGLDKNATEKEIRTAYRKLVKQYHPDRVASLGKELQDLANKKFIEIKDAYNFLMKS